MDGVVWSVSAIENVMINSTQFGDAILTIEAFQIKIPLITPISRNPAKRSLSLTTCLIVYQ